jgi:predicted small lipoprotein YifL
MRSFMLFLLTLLFVAGCGQKGPLFLPGDPSQVRTTTPQQQPADDNDDDDDEDPITIQK